MRARGRVGWGGGRRAGGPVGRPREGGGQGEEQTQDVLHGESFSDGWFNMKKHRPARRGRETVQYYEEKPTGNGRLAVFCGGAAAGGLPQPVVLVPAEWIRRLPLDEAV